MDKWSWVSRFIFFSFYSVFFTIKWNKIKVENSKWSFEINIENISYQECFQSQDVENTFYKFESFMTDR